MNISEICREIKGVFKKPRKVYYFGKIKSGTPYFNPRYFIPTIFYIRKLIHRSEQDVKEYKERYPYSKNYKYLNLPMVRRSYDKIVKLFGVDYYITWGWPFSVVKLHLGWKDKYDTPRFEWVPAFMIFFFKWQFCIHYVSPYKDDHLTDIYYEMIVWYLKYSDKDLGKAKESWPWICYKTSKSTWGDKYLIDN